MRTTAVTRAQPQTGEPAVVKRQLADLFTRTLDRLALRRILPEKVSCRDGVLRVGAERIDLARYERVIGIAFGKAAFEMAEILAGILSPLPFSGVASGVAGKSAKLPGFTCFHGGHPYPNGDSFRAGEEVVDLVGRAGPRDLVIYLLSGGGSAICEKPLFPEIPREDYQEFYELLVTCGASILDVNYLRKHFSAIKGGRLAERAWPARQLTLYVSDAPPGSPSNVASGPTMPDESTVEDCYAVLETHRLMDRLPASIRGLLRNRRIPETPKLGSDVFQTSTWHCLLDPEDALEALAEETRRLGWRVAVDRSVNDDTPLDRATERLLGKLEALGRAHPGETVAVLAGHEFSCPVRGGGVGGRNQAFVLDCVPKIAGRNVAVLSAGTDGVDGVSPAAGAVADGGSLRRAEAMGLDALDFARRSDSYNFFSRLKDAIVTGPTGNNLRDLRILVSWPASGEASRPEVHSRRPSMKSSTTLAPFHFCHGIAFLGEAWPDFEAHGRSAAISEGETAVPDPSAAAAVYQTLLGADALRYLTLQMTAAKGSGHPGGFASAADVVAALWMLGHTAILTESGHHAPGFYAASFLDGALEEIGIENVSDLCRRFRERGGLLGHVSARIPGILAPAGPLGQGQHFAMAAALRNPGRLFPVTIGDGGLGEPYVLSSMMHFHAAYPETTNFLPVLIWNGYSQEHHSMVSTLSNRAMADHWKGHGFENVVLVDAKDFDDREQPGPYVDATRFSFRRRLAFSGALLEGASLAAASALGGALTALVVKQIKGAGLHALGAASHALSPRDTLDEPGIAEALKLRALTPEAFRVVRENFMRAGGGPATKRAVFRRATPLVDLPIEEAPVGERRTPSTAMGNLAAVVGKLDPGFVVANADGNQASGMFEINKALIVRHPTEDDRYRQGPEGRVYEPVSEDACAGLVGALAHFGGRSLWLSYESFAVNGLPVWQTVTQAMAELPHRVPSAIAMFTAGALEQGRNGWTHQRPEIEGYLAAMVRNGNVFLLFPTDANGIQAAYDWAVRTFNKGIAIVASKTPLPVYTTLAQSRRALDEGAVLLHESPGAGRATVVLAAAGDAILGPVFEAKDALEGEGYRVRIVSVVNPRRLYRPEDVAWESVAEPDGGFLGEREFDSLFQGDVLIGVTGGAAAALEPVLLRAKTPHRDVLCWKRGETAASAGELLDLNRLTADDVVRRARDWSERRLSPARQNVPLATK